MERGTSSDRRITLAIHERPGSFSDEWIHWCEREGVPFIRVSAYDSDIVAKVRGCSGFLWHWSHDSEVDQLFARQLSLGLERAGIGVFPSVATAWHFDDKIGQKYLLEAARLALVPAHVFYGEKAALDWLSEARFPVVFKLRGGAGSSNVWLVRTPGAARGFVRRAFRSGFPAFDRWHSFRQTWWELRRDRSARRFARAAYYFARAVADRDRLFMRRRGREVGYAYFQEFVPDNSFDDRLVVIGNRCFGLRRHCRTGDFRASGSGVFEYDHDLFPRASVKLAFEVARSLGTQSVAMDIVYDADKRPMLLEISYAFATGSVYESCDGYFDDAGVWWDRPVRPQEFMITDFVATLEARVN